MTLIATPQQTSGPLFGFALLYEGSQHAVDPEGEDAVTIEGRVTEETGLPLTWEAEVEFWIDDQFARARTMDDGIFSVVVSKPGARPMSDGIVLAPYVNVMLFGRGINGRLDTRMYFPDEESANATDPILALVAADRRATLIARQSGPPGKLRFDIVLRGESETVFFDY